MPNEARQPTPGGRLAAWSAPVARRGCALRYAKRRDANMKKENRATYRGCATVILAILSSVLLCEPRGIAQVATFESFPEGAVGAWFVDPASGIIFTNPVRGSAGGPFCIDYSTNPPALPGNHLTVGGYTPGPAFGGGSGIGFTFILPTPSSYLQMDEVYFPEFYQSFSISVAAYASNGQQVLQTNVLLALDPACFCGCNNSESHSHGVFGFFTRTLLGITQSGPKLRHGCFDYTLTNLRASCKTTPTLSKSPGRSPG